MVGSQPKSDFDLLRRVIVRCANAICGLVLLVVAFTAPARAQSAIAYPNTIASALTDNNCTAAATISKTFVVPFSYIVDDVDLGVLVTHTYRSDLRISLISPAGTNVTVVTWTGNVQSGDNVNDRFDDEATAALTTHNATVNDPIVPAPPPYSHSFKPSSPLSVFDGQNALGTWTMTICDAVAADLGTFNRADLFITPRPAAISVSKISSVMGDGVSVTNPKAISGSTVQYCINISNAGPSAATNVTAADAIPADMTYVAASMFSGTSCATATTAEDDNAAGADESDPVGASITGTTITAVSANLALSASFAILFSATVN
jgi:uncharacterized repeat protein (TIGR01451 family)